MAANKVVFGNKVLIDLTGDTVTEEALLKGYTAHKADGTIITGTAFAGYPNEFVFLDNIQDSSGNPIKDSSGKTIQGQTIYRKARNSVLLDSTGDVIEDGFEQQIEVVKFVWVSFISRLFLHLNPLGTVNAGQFVSIYKPYSNTLSTGKQIKTKNTDHVRNVEFVYAKASDGQPLYIGWLALTDFSGMISDEAIQGIRLRKGNILVGDNTTFAKYFPSEGHSANRMFVGEIHALHIDLVPNSQRDDFEPNAIYSEFRESLGKWAGELNKKYRRGMSEATSALRRLEQLNTTQKELEDKINSGAITSDERREQIAEQLRTIVKKREGEEKIVRRAQERGTFDVDRKETIEKILQQTETAAKKITSLNKKVVDADYATKNDLPSSYSREERKLYQRIIKVIDSFFIENPQMAEKLRDTIKKELSVKKK